jgi:hypothetical protein
MNQPEYTRKQFDELTIDQVWWHLTPRIIILPEGEVMTDSMEEGKDWWDRMIMPEGIEKPSREQFDAEFATYKAELLVVLEPLWQLEEEISLVRATFQELYNKDHGFPAYLQCFPEVANPVAHFEANVANSEFRAQFTQNVIAAQIPIDKQSRITEKYNLLNAEVYAQMASVFGTTNPESATANHNTWSTMVQYPTAFVGSLGFTTNEEVLNFAQPKLDASITYSIYRLQRIEQFRQERISILAE